MFALSFDLWGRVNVHAVTSQIQAWPPLYNISQRFHVLLFMLYYFNQLYFCSFQYWIASAVWWTELQGYATCLYTHTFAHSVNCRLEHGMPGDIYSWILWRLDPSLPFLAVSGWFNLHESLLHRVGMVRPSSFIFWRY